jgi:hypothetical protein
LNWMIPLTDLTRLAPWALIPSAIDAKTASLFRPEVAGAAAADADADAAGAAAAEDDDELEAAGLLVVSIFFAASVCE